MRGIVISPDPYPANEKHVADSHYSPVEIGMMPASLADADRQRIFASSRYLARDHHILAADLRQEAFVRALDGRRK